MKNLMILITVALLGLLLWLRYQSGKSETAAVPVPATRPLGEVGVALPPGGAETASYYDQAFVSPPPAEPLPAPVPTEEKTMCPGGSVSAVLAAQGKTWGRTVPSRLDDMGIVDHLYETTGRYLACKAVAKTDISVCNALQTRIAKGVPDSRRQCQASANKVLFTAYMAGVLRNRSVCEGFVRSNLGGGNINTETFCSAAAKGPENLSEQFSSGGKKLIPSNKAGCKGDEGCLAGFAVYEALKARNPMRCPEQLQPLCSAFFSKSVDSCSELAMSVSVDYCQYMRMVEDLKKKPRAFGVVAKPGQ